ncbi:hypothetical protein, partial [Methylobacterium sp. Leaf108]|uniref:hypothetical protein n=1 Tax=Methylobacterium sp. Leaf108 TaxID=1736256 RepID=UPI001AEBE159
VAHVGEEQIQTKPDRQNQHTHPKDKNTATAKPLQLSTSQPIQKVKTTTPPGSETAPRRRRRWTAL